MNLEQKPVDPEKEKQIQTIVEQLEEKGWMQVLLNESIGGNAGHNRAAINGFARRDTGKIVAWGNIQDIEDGVRNNPDNASVTFLYDFGTSFEAIRRKLLPNEIVPEYFVDVAGSNLSADALANLREAIKRFNSEYENKHQSQAEL